MRVMADRAGFAVKMEYASDRIVTDSELLTFLSALQQHHQIAYMPSVPVGKQVTRGEYLTILYRLFAIDEYTEQVSVLSSQDHSASQVAQLVDTPNTNTVSRESSQDVVVPDGLQQELLDYAQSLWDESIPQVAPATQQDIGINMQAVHETRQKIQQWLGRS